MPKNPKLWEAPQMTPKSCQYQGRIESPRTRGHATRDHQKLYEYIHFP